VLANGDGSVTHPNRPFPVIVQLEALHVSVCDFQVESQQVCYLTRTTREN
jgi:hypothetical protein